jgi:hypothetical protein
MENPSGSEQHQEEMFRNAYLFVTNEIAPTIVEAIFRLEFSPGVSFL